MDVISSKKALNIQALMNNQDFLFENLLFSNERFLPMKKNRANCPNLALSIARATTHIILSDERCESGMHFF